MVLNGDHEKALKAAQKAIHYYPNVVECWAILISALRTQTSSVYGKLIGKVAGHVKRLEPSKEVLLWIDTHINCNKVL